MPVIFSSRETSWTSCGREAILWRTAASPEAAFSRSCRAFTSSSVCINTEQLEKKTKPWNYVKQIKLLPYQLGSRGICAVRGDVASIVIIFIIFVIMDLLIAAFYWLLFFYCLEITEQSQKGSQSHKCMLVILLWKVSPIIIKPAILTFYKQSIFERAC